MYIIYVSYRLSLLLTGIVKMDGKNSKVLVSNDVKDNKLYLRINERRRKRRRRVTVKVAKSYNVSL